MTGQLQIGIDCQLNLILVEGRGIWTLDVVDTHFDRLDDMVSELRGRNHAIGMLIDLKNADMQPADVIERIAARNHQIFSDDDRLAVVVGSSLAKIQMKRCVEHLPHKFFLSMRAARTWLCGAFSNGAPANGNGNGKHHP